MSGFECRKQYVSNCSSSAPIPMLFFSTEKYCISSHKDFSNKKEEIDENTKKVIQDIQNDYNEKKDEKINEMIEKILR